MVYNCKFTREIQGMWRYLNILIDDIDILGNMKKSTFPTNIEVPPLT